MMSKDGGGKAEGWAERRAQQMAASKGKKTAQKRRAEMIRHAAEGAQHGEELIERAREALGDSHNPEKVRIADMVARALAGNPIQPKEESDEEIDFGGAESEGDYDDSDDDEAKRKKAPLFCPGGGGKAKRKPKR